MLKIRNFKFVIPNCQKGMTYVEIIVVLSIFSLMTSIIMFDYGKFQEKIDIKILANDIALKIVEAQKISISGELTDIISDSTWKPSYGIYLDKSNPKIITYFADQDNDGYKPTGEGTLEKIAITKGNYISELEYVGLNCTTTDDLSIIFKRPNSSAIIDSKIDPGCVFSSVKITVSSPKLITAVIEVDPSGRIQIK